MKMCITLTNLHSCKITYYITSFERQENTQYFTYRWPPLSVSVSCVQYNHLYTIYVQYNHLYTIYVHQVCTIRFTTFYAFLKTIYTEEQNSAEV